MSIYEPTEFHADQWDEEPFTLEAEEQRLKDYYFAYIQRYQGDRDLDWLHETVFETGFGTREWEGEHKILEMFLKFAKCVFYVDEQEESIRFCLQQIDSFFSDYEDISSTNPDIQEIIHDMRQIINNRREYIMRLSSRRNSDSSSSSDSSD